MKKMCTNFSELHFCIVFVFEWNQTLYTFFFLSGFPWFEFLNPKNL